MRINATQSRAETRTRVVITKPFANKSLRDRSLGTPRHGTSGNYEARIYAAQARTHPLR